MSDEKLDRFARGELSPAEARELARNALDDPELFEELTYTAVAKTAMEQRKPRRKPWAAATLLAAAAAIVIAAVSLNVLRTSPEGSGPAPAPAVALGPPIFLAAPGSNGAFRSAEPESRAPRAVGSVTGIADGNVTINLGSVDGLAKGEEVEIVHDGDLVGRVALSTIFRETSRAQTPAGRTVRLNDEVRVPPPAHLRALLDQIAASSSRGDSDSARRMAEEAAAVEKIDLPAASYDDLNNLGGIAALSGDRSRARSLYDRALSANPPPDARRAIESNLARVRDAK